MTDFIYALAPAGATHHIHGCYRKLENGKVSEWISGEWIFGSGLQSGSYEPIPERDQELNRLADDHNFDYVRYNSGYGISTSDVLERRALRIEYGLFDPSPFDATTSDNEFKSCDSCSHNGNQSLFRSGCTGCNADGTEYQNYDAIRIEHGLIASENNDLNDVNDTDVVETQEWNGEGLPPIGVAHQAKNVNWNETWANPEWTNQIITAHGKEMFLAKDISDDSMEGAGFYRQWKFRPIKTAEQLAAEKEAESRKEIIDGIAGILSAPNWHNYNVVAGDILDYIEEIYQLQSRQTEVESLNAENGRLREQVELLSSAITDYQKIHDLKGGSSIESGRAWDRMSAAVKESGNE
jgi:hypothetical protein